MSVSTTQALYNILQPTPSFSDLGGFGPLAFDIDIAMTFLHRIMMFDCCSARLENPAVATLYFCHGLGCIGHLARLELLLYVHWTVTTSAEMLI